MQKGVQVDSGSANGTKLQEFIDEKGKQRDEDPQSWSKR